MTKNKMMHTRARVPGGGPVQVQLALVGVSRAAAVAGSVLEVRWPLQVLPLAAAREADLCVQPHK